MIFSEDKLEYKLYIKKFLSKLQNVKLQVDITKLYFYVSKVAYVGLIVTICDVWIDLAKVDTIIYWLIFRNLKVIQSFLDFVNFYQCLIYKFSCLAASLTTLTKKDVKFI